MAVFEPIDGPIMQDSVSAELLTEAIITVGARASVLAAAFIVWGLWNNLRTKDCDFAKTD